MSGLTLKDLFAEVPVLFMSGNDRTEIRGLAYSSKDVRPGFLFAALKGEKADGNAFVADALAGGRRPSSPSVPGLPSSTRTGSMSTTPGNASPCARPITTAIPRTASRSPGSRGRKGKRP